MITIININISSKLYSNDNGIFTSRMPGPDWINEGAKIYHKYEIECAKLLFCLFELARKV